MPGHGLHAFAVKSLDPPVDGSGTTKQQDNDILPGIASVQEQQDVGAEAGLGIGVLTISVQQRLALPDVESHATVHGCKYRGAN